MPPPPAIHEEMRRSAKWSSGGRQTKCKRPPPGRPLANCWHSFLNNDWKDTGLGRFFIVGRIEKKKCNTKFFDFFENGHADCRQGIAKAKIELLYQKKLSVATGGS